MGAAGSSPPAPTQVSPIESLRLMCLLSITENGEVFDRTGQGGAAPGPSSLGAELNLVLPTGLIPKDYRSLKTQYLQVRDWGLTAEQVLCWTGLPLPACCLPQGARQQHYPGVLRLSLLDGPCLHGLCMSPELCLPPPFACGVALSRIPHGGGTLPPSHARSWGSVLIQLPPSPELRA